MLNTLISNNKYSSIYTKFLIYKTSKIEIWTYGPQLWGNTENLNINNIQTFQNIALRKQTNTPLYVTNYTLHTGQKLKTISEEANRHLPFHYRYGSRRRTYVYVQPNT